MTRQPRQRDGRHVDPRLGALEGEGAAQRVRREEPPVPGRPLWREVPSSGATYYDLPVVKEPVWIWAVPAYFYAGGTAGAAAVIGAAARLAGDGRLDGLALLCRRIAAAGTALGTALLIHDLGRPERFLNMLRVFRPTSAMSFGSWVLTAASGTAAVAALAGRREGPVGRVGDAAGAASGLLGMPLCGYTAVLLSETAVPLWKAVRRSLPALFAGSSLAGAAALLELSGPRGAEAKVTHRLLVLGQAAELAAGLAVEREADRVERVGRPLHQGLSGALWKAAKTATAAGLAMTVLGARSRGVRRAGAVLATLGSLATRFAVFQAGRASAGDPRATFDQQRA